MLLFRKFIIVLGVLSFSFNTAIAANLKDKSVNQTSPDKIIVAEEKAERVNINTADLETLQKIKYFGKKKAQAVIEYRNKNGVFKSPDDLLKVKARGLNQKWLDKISKSLTV
jgi:competence ComEA-like helix-hairpin-helix protein